MKIELNSQGREMILFLTTNMAAVTSLANLQTTNRLEAAEIETCTATHLNGLILGPFI